MGPSLLPGLPRSGPLAFLHILLLLFPASTPNLTVGNCLHVVTRADFAPVVASIVCSQSLLGLSLLPGLPPNGPLALLLIIPLYFPLHSSLWFYSALSLAPCSVFVLGETLAQQVPLIGSNVPNHMLQQEVTSGAM